MAKLYEPKQVSKELDISASMLRRYCQVYESLYGMLPRDARNGRLFEAEVFAHFKTARNLIEKEKQTLEDAFKTLNGSVELIESEASIQATGEEALELLRSMAREMEALKVEVQQLRNQLEAKGELFDSKELGLFQRVWKALFPNN